MFYTFLAIFLQILGEWQVEDVVDDLLHMQLNITSWRPTTPSEDVAPIIHFDPTIPNVSVVRHLEVHSNQRTDWHMWTQLALYSRMPNVVNVGLSEYGTWCPTQGAALPSLSVLSSMQHLRLSSFKTLY